MNNFKGFDRDTFLLLAENRFNDSKVYYDKIKDTLKQKAIIPMRNICSDLSEQLYEIDNKMNLVPVKMVSRIRRDTRRAKDLNMYRDNVWCMFMRHKYEWSYQPCMWFEIMPGGYTIGVGMFKFDASYLEKYRETLLSSRKEFKAALESVESVGAQAVVERYSKDKPGKVPGWLNDYYNAKNLFFIKSCTDFEPLFDGSVLLQLQKVIDAYAPMYKFLLKVTDKMISEKGG